MEMDILAFCSLEDACISSMGMSVFSSPCMCAYRVYSNETKLKLTVFFKCINKRRGLQQMVINIIQQKCGCLFKDKMVELMFWVKVHFKLKEK